RSPSPGRNKDALHPKTRRKKHSASGATRRARDKSVAAWWGFILCGSNVFVSSRLPDRIADTGWSTSSGERTSHQIEKAGAGLERLRETNAFVGVASQRRVLLPCVTMSLLLGPRVEPIYFRRSLCPSSCLIPAKIAPREADRMR